MSEETIHESTPARGRRAIASYLRRVADAFDDGDLIPVDEEGTVTVDPPKGTGLEAEVEREDGEMSFELELEWSEDEGGVELDADAGSDGTFELFQDRADEWRWRLRHANGNIIADSGEGYTDRRDAENGIESVRRNAPGASVERED